MAELSKIKINNVEYSLKDPTSRETIPTKTSQLENDSGFLTEHQDISGKLDADKLPAAVEDALAQAKASGEFVGEKGEKGDKGDTGATGATGANGYTPVKGTDYWTNADIAEIKSYVDDAILGGAW